MIDCAASGVRRVVRPQCRDMPFSAEQDGELARLLSQINSIYAEACDRLAVRARPVTLARFLDAGFCIGLLDPVSNIIANTACTSESNLRPEVPVGAAVEQKLDDMCRRSLDGLVAFLVYFFPYLAEWEAVRYLLLADADLLAAAHLLVADRGMTARFSLTFPASAPAFEAALTLAARVAKHPQPERLVRAWMSLSSRLHQAIALLREVQHHSPRENVERLRPLLDDPVVPYLAIPWDLAVSRPINIGSIADIPYQHTRSLRMVLLDTIHGFYLKAMARLPGGELRSRLHRGLLRAGCCYGPMDPVSNIVLNTVWYEANFPAEITPVLDVIGPKSLTALTCGQLSAADNNYVPGDVSPDDARSILHGPFTKVEQQIPSAGIQEGYEAAATAAWHPNPEQQAMFLTSWGGSGRHILTSRQCSSLHEKQGKISLEEVQYLYSFLSPKQPPIPERICSSSYHVRAGKMRSQAQQRRISRKVKAALNRHLLGDDGEPEFELHIICCVNEDVCGPEYCKDVEDSLSFAPYKYQYSHVNFLATQKGSRFSDSRPILFFAEFGNEEDDGAPLFCCQVDEPTPFTEHVRCLYCEATGARVVHPTSDKFQGGGSEFEKICGEHSLDNDFLICKNEYAVQRMFSVEEDYMYVDVN